MALVTKGKAAALVSATARRYIWRGDATTSQRASATLAGARVVAAAPPSSRGAAAWAHGPEAVAPSPHYVFARIASARLRGVEAELACALQLPHNIWSEHSLNGVQLACIGPGSIAYSAAAGLARGLARSSEVLTHLTLSRERWWLRHVLFLSTLSGAPAKAVVVAKWRATDKWTKSLLKEADNEQARLQILMEVHSIGRVGQSVLGAAQGVLANGFLVAWCVMPRFCKWFGHYMDEEQVNAYTLLLEDLDAGRLQHFADMQASGLARAHYGLPEGASLREVFLRMKAEEMFSL